jgi:hypothetical protein
MSLFGSIMSDLERDPIFGAHHRAMNRMMGGFFGGGGTADLFGIDHGHGHGQGHGGHGQHQQQSIMPFGGHFGGGAMDVFGGGGLFGPLGGFPSSLASFNAGNMHSPNSAFYSSSSVTSISAGPDGRPHVYQASSSTRAAPGGIRETRKTLADSRTGTKRMEVGRHLGDRGLVREKEENIYTGQREENEEYINLDEDEAPAFQSEWTRAAHGGIRSGVSEVNATPSLRYHPAYHRQHRDRRADREAQAHAHAQRDAPRLTPNTTTRGGVTIEELPSTDDEEAEEMVVDPIPVPQAQPQPQAHAHAHAQARTSRSRPSASASAAKAAQLKQRNKRVKKN